MRASLLLLLAPPCAPIDIPSIQYSTNAGEDAECYPSPLLGEEVNASGVVTSVHRDSLTMQSAPAPWSGIALHTGLAHPLLSLARVGDAINVSGRVAEVNGMTYLANLSSYEIVSTGNSAAAVLVTSGQLGSDCNFEGESYEGVLVTIEGVEVEGGGTCDSISIQTDGSEATRLSLSKGTMLASVTGAARANRLL